jgi:hypothetical protein
LLGAEGGLGFGVGKDADRSGGNFVVDNGFVVFADDVNTKFLYHVKAKKSSWE